MDDLNYLAQRVRAARILRDDAESTFAMAKEHLVVAEAHYAAECAVLDQAIGRSVFQPASSETVRERLEREAQRHYDSGIASPAPFDPVHSPGMEDLMVPPESIEKVEAPPAPPLHEPKMPRAGSQGETILVALAGKPKTRAEIAVYCREHGHPKMSTDSVSAALTQLRSLIESPARGLWMRKKVSKTPPAPPPPTANDSAADQSADAHDVVEIAVGRYLNRPEAAKHLKHLTQVGEAALAEIVKIYRPGGRTLRKAARVPVFEAVQKAFEELLAGPVPPPIEEPAETPIDDALFEPGKQSAVESAAPPPPPGIVADPLEDAALYGHVLQLPSDLHAVVWEKFFNKKDFAEIAVKLKSTEEKVRSLYEEGVAALNRMSEDKKRAQANRAGVSF